MQLSQEALDEFKEIYKKEFGKEISDADAREMGSRVLRIFKLLHEDLIERAYNNDPEVLDMIASGELKISRYRK